MPVSVCTDEQFIELWRDLQSPVAVARVLGITERNAFSRRNKIEQEHGIELTTAETRNPTKQLRENIKIIQNSKRDVMRVEIGDGTMLVGSDAHYSPGVIPIAHKALCNVLCELGSEVRAIVLNGDILDGGSISKHARIRWSRQVSIKDELEVVQQRLGEIEKVRPAGCHLLRTYGNHDMRFETRLSNAAPQYEGIAGFLLRDHLPHWDDADRIDVNDDTVIIHDWHQGVHSGWNDVLKGGCNTVTGHTHELSCKAHRGFKKTNYGIKTGMLADNDQEEFNYRLSKPGLNWQSGFAVLTWADGMMLHPEFCAVRDDGRAYFRGKLVAT